MLFIYVVFGILLTFNNNLIVTIYVNDILRLISDVKSSKTYYPASEIQKGCRNTAKLVSGGRETDNATLYLKINHFGLQ